MHKKLFGRIDTKLKIINERQIEPEKYSGFIAYILRL